MPSIPGRGRPAGCSAWGRLSSKAPVAPDVAGRLDPLRLRRLIDAPIGIPLRRSRRGGTGLAVILLLRPHRGGLRRNVTAVVVVIVSLIPLVTRLPGDVVAVGIWRHPVIAARLPRGVGILPRHQLILSVHDLALAVDPETFGDRFAAADRGFAGF